MAFERLKGTSTTHSFMLKTRTNKKKTTINRRLLLFLQFITLSCCMNVPSFTTPIFFSNCLYGLCLEMMNSVRSWIQSPMRSYIFCVCNPLFSSLKDIASSRLELERKNQLSRGERTRFQPGM